MDNSEIQTALLRYTTSISGIKKKHSICTNEATELPFVVQPNNATNVFMSTSLTIS